MIYNPLRSLIHSHFIGPILIGANSWITMNGWVQLELDAAAGPEPDSYGSNQLESDPAIHEEAPMRMGPMKRECLLLVVTVLHVYKVHF